MLNNTKNRLLVMENRSYSCIAPGQADLPQENIALLGVVPVLHRVQALAFSSALEV